MEFVHNFAAFPVARVYLILSFHKHTPAPERTLVYFVSPPPPDLSRRLGVERTSLRLQSWRIKSPDPYNLSNPESSSLTIPSETDAISI